MLNRKSQNRKIQSQTLEQWLQMRLQVLATLRGRFIIPK
jgi:hypothetical protein